MQHENNQKKKKMKIEALTVLARIMLIPLRAGMRAQASRANFKATCGASYILSEVHLKCIFVWIENQKVVD